MELQIVRFSPAHADAVSALIIRNLLKVNSKDYPMEEMRRFALEFSPARLLLLARGRIIFVALDAAGEPIGTGGLGCDSAGGWLVLSLFVRPDMQKSGVGRLLLERIEAHARSMGVERLLMHASLSADGFYVKQGCRYVDGTRVRDPAGHYKMEKFLPASRPIPMKLLALSPTRGRPIVLVGSGGKSNLTFLLASQFAREGLSVAITTTTRIPRPTGELVCESGIPALLRGTLTVYGRPAADGCLEAPDAQTLAALRQRAQVLLIEAGELPYDGAPPLPPQADCVIALAGLSVLGRPPGEVCRHTPLSHRALTEPITPALMARLLLRGYSTISGLTMLLSQADTPALREQGEQIAAMLRDGGIKKVLVMSSVNIKQEEHAAC